MRSLMCVTAGALALGIVAGTAAAQNLAVSIGIRETVAGGGPVVGIGANGGSAGGIEFVNLNGQTLVLDGTWQTFTFNFQADALTAFAGTTANSMYDGTRGVLEMIRFTNVDGLTAPLQIFVDDIVNTTSAGPNIVSGFETTDPFPAALNTEHIFQEPRFSGSTSSFLELAPNIARVTDTMVNSGVQSYEVQWQFNSNNPAGWLRLTTFGATNQPNPAIDFADGSTLTFALKGLVIPEPSTLALLGIGGLALLRRRK